MEIDQSLARVPFEALKRAAKERKALVDEVSEALASADARKGSLSPAEQVAQLDQVITQLRSVKQRLAEVSRTEKDEAGRCSARLQHLAAVGVPSKGQSAIAWNRSRLDRLLVDHLLRSGLPDSAAALAASVPGLAPLTDLHIFEGAQPVLEGLARHDCTAALAWCAAQRSRLKKLKSSLEFKLRLQEFLEFVRQDERLRAIKYARAHLAPWAAQHMAELQRAVATLAFTSRTKCEPYRQLFDDSRWAELRELFLRELYRLQGLPQESLLTVHLQAGLAALKTPASDAQGGSKEDPLHLPAFQALAAGLPFAKHVHSKLVCAVTKEVMGDANPPMVLPNGLVYSTRACELIIAANGGQMVCPKTGAVCTPEELRRAFIV